MVGGGDSAMEEALFLTRFATKVTLIHRREQFRASRIMLDRAIAHPKIKFLTNTVIEEVLDPAKKEVTGVRILDATTGIESDLHLSGLFLGIGHIPNAAMFAGQLDLDEDGYIKTHNNVFTRSPRRLRLRRRAGPPLPPGHHRRRYRMHGRPRSRKILRRTRPLTSPEPGVLPLPPIFDFAEPNSFRV